MKITEIELVGEQNWPIEKIAQILSMSTPHGSTIDEYNVNYVEKGNQRMIILTDNDRSISAFATFEMWNNGKVWQARNCQSYPPHQGKNLVAKIYKFVKTVLHKSIQSDTEQSYGGKRLWAAQLPSIGLDPKIFDTKTERIIDPSTVTDVNALMYPAVSTPSDTAQWRYTWIIEHRDHYPSQNLLAEGSLVQPIQGLWKKD